MNWISITLFFTAFLIFCTMLKKNADALSPAKVFGFAWSVVLALTNLKLSRLQFEWTFTQWIYVVMGPLSFLLGLFITYILNRKFKFRSIKEIRKIIKAEKINTTRLFILTVVAFITYLIGYIGVSLAKGHVPMFAANPSAARTDFIVFGIAMFIPNMAVVLFFSMVYNLYADENPGKKWILKIISLVTIISYLFLLQRYQFIMVTIMIFAFLYYATRYIRIKTMLFFALLGIVIIYLISTLRSGRILEYWLYINSEMKFSPKYAILTEPYMYMVMNVENFINAVSKLDHFTYGCYTFDWFFALIQLKYPIQEYFGLISIPYTVGGYNTHTFFWTFYRDFGIFGISLLPLICGFAVGSVYYSLRRNPTVELVSYYSITVFLLAMSFFINPLGFLWFVYIVAWILMVVKLIRIRE